MKIATILSAHENSPVYKDTLDSVRTYFSDDVVVLVDGFGWNQFSFEDVDKIEGFRHGKPSNPFRNVALGLMGAWERWGSGADWYCYMEYDCLVTSSDTKHHLGIADRQGIWMLGNDIRIMNGSIPALDRIEKGIGTNPHYLLGCCCFYSREFMRVMAEKDVFTRVLEMSNFYLSDPVIRNPSGKTEMVYDTSEVLYPSLAVRYGGSPQQLACWDAASCSWSGNYQQYPMRFRPEISESENFPDSCVIHPLKDFDGPLRKLHRQKRHLTASA